MPSNCGLEGVDLVLCILKIIHISLNKSDNMKTKYDIGFKIQNIVVGSAVWLHKPNEQSYKEIVKVHT
jgi:hypothetical protein